MDRHLTELIVERIIIMVMIAGVLTKIRCESSDWDVATLGFQVVMIAHANAAISNEA